MEISQIQSTAVREWYSRFTATVSSTSGGTTDGSVDSVQLSGLLSYSATYTETGTLSSLTPDTEGISVQGLLPETETSQTGESSSLSFTNYQASFLEIIKNRVEFLLQAIAQASGNTSSASTTTSDVLSTGSTDSMDTIDLGIWSPEQTASRILNFALAFYDGGDREEYASMVRDAVMEGYNQAKDMMGGSLPTTADETISLVLDALDQFAAVYVVNTVA